MTASKICCTPLFLKALPHITGKSSPEKVQRKKSGLAINYLNYISILKLLKIVIGLRVSEKEEREGLDKNEHGINAYPEFRLND